MLDKLRQVESKYEALCARSEQPDFYADPQAAAQNLREQRELEPVVGAYRAYMGAKARMDEAQAMLAEDADPELRALCQEEFRDAKAESERLEGELKLLLLPKDPNDSKSVIMEIRGGVGGEESALFAHSLFRMYSMYAQARGWSVELLNYSETELGGVREADFIINGTGAWSRLKFESGVHRVQLDVDLRPEDIEMQVFRASGAGGQHINKTSSAVRLIHRPTGITVSCQEERSQVQNRERCMQMLASKLYEIEQTRISSEYAADRKSQVGTGMRNERIRTYNFPQGRVTDHRIGLSLYKIDAIMDGDLDELIDALVTADQADRLRRNEAQT